jgi:predicted lipid-binding transport protein (Tim44 family)
VSHDDDPWFVYRRTASRIRAAPANWKGWAVLAGGIAATVVLGWGAMQLTQGMHPLLQGLALTAAIAVGVLLILRVVLAKGRHVG